MQRIIRTKRSGQILGSMFCLLGFIVLVAVFWKAWPNASVSSNPFSALWSQILSEQLSLASWVAVKLIYLVIMGTVFLVLGVAVLALSRQIFYLSGSAVSLQCPYCKNSWKARRAMGWAECPYCRKFIQPLTAKKGM